MTSLPLGVLLVGCLEFHLDPVEGDPLPPPPVVVTETFVQTPLPRVDLLLVIDDTSSMAQEQAAVAEELVALLDELDAVGVAWQLGVVTTDMGTPEAGWLRGTPWIVTPTTPDREAAFARMVEVGTVGGGPEAGLAAAERALALSDPAQDGAPGPNSGFRRDDALLHVVFVSDADDQSETWLGPDPVSAFLGVLASESELTGLPAVASGLVGPTPDGCTSATGTAQAAARYSAVVASTGGVEVSICEPDLAPVVSSLAAASIAWSVRFELRQAPEGPTTVTVDGQPLPVGWAVDGAVLVFEVPPAPGAEIVVTYTVRPR